ncbi:MAG: ATP-binding cassette domain-containing protein, partial [Candidatus Thermoplasmatota archaeon]|nr:ATP-binding cassette domain-containing protein [Candidatus Thermoplasmatota archaeon]
NIAFGARINGFTGDMEELVESSLRKAALWDECKDKLNDSGYSLSGGQQQRVAVARAIAGSRPLLLADEPTGNLDVKAGESIISLFKELCADPDDPISVLMVTHDPILASKADRMLLMRDGKTAASDIRSAWGESTGDPI